MKSFLVKVCPSWISLTHSDHLEREEDDAEAGGDVRRGASPLDAARHAPAARRGPSPTSWSAG